MSDERGEQGIVVGTVFLGVAVLLLFGIFTDSKNRKNDFLLFLLIVCTVIGLISIIVGLVKRAIQKEKERQRNLAIIIEKEKEPALLKIPNPISSENKESELLNTQFREFLKQTNEITIAESHLNYLLVKRKAYYDLKRAEEGDALNPDIENAYKQLNAVKSKRTTTFSSKYADILNQASDLCANFRAFSFGFPDETIPLISDFFHGHTFKALRTESNFVLVFTPCYVITYDSRALILSILPYERTSFHTNITSEMIPSVPLPTDEIARYSFLHETKDGRQDMRYALENNPRRIYVYRGTATIRCGALTGYLYFNNKSKAQSFEMLYNNFLKLINGKYKATVNLICAHSDRLFGRANPSPAQPKYDSASTPNQSQSSAAQAQADRQTVSREQKSTTSYTQAAQTPQTNCTIINGELVAWRGYDHSFSVPTSVSKIGSAAFRWKRPIESLHLPESVTTIAPNAFQGCTNLKSINLPSGLTTIGAEAFLGCKQLSSVSLPKSLNTISPWMFANCVSLKTLTIPEGVEVIEKCAFSGCEGLQEIVLPESIISIKDNAFERCTSLAGIVIPHSTKEVGHNLFYDCPSLQYVFIGDGIERIPPSFLENHPSVKDVTLSSEVTEIGDCAFKNCPNLQHIRFSTSDSCLEPRLRRIGKYAFENCSSLPSFSLQEGLETIDDYAFLNCVTMESTFFPGTLENLGEGVYAGCSKLLDVIGTEHVNWHRKGCFKGTPWLLTQAIDGCIIDGDYIEDYLGNDTVVYIPKEAKIIGKSAFNRNRSIEEIHIPYGVTAIEEYAFANCGKLTRAYIPDSVTEISDTAFSNDNRVTIYCSRGSEASAFRIRNKIAGEYVSKAKPSRTSGTVEKPSRAVGENNISDLTEEEFRMIMEMRRKKLEAQKHEAEELAQPEERHFILTEFDNTKVALQLREDSRKISNNIFHLVFDQIEPMSDGKAPAEYETFVIDSRGQIISNIKSISANKTEGDMSYKVTCALSSQKSFSKDSNYFVVLRYKGEESNIVCKIQYQISIAFAADFDF